MIKTVIFDLGKVIIPFDLQRGYQGLYLVCGLEPDEVRKRIAGAGIVAPFEEGRISPQDFVDALSRALGVRLEFDRFCELWSSIFLPDPLLPEELLEGLRRRYRLLLLSNTNAIHFDMIRRTYPILRHFHEFVLSYEVGAMKPDERIYQAAIERARCLPQECFFTDDMEAFVEGARRAGIDAVQFRSAVQIERELRDRGVRW